MYDAECLMGTLLHMECFNKINVTSGVTNKKIGFMNLGIECSRSQN